MIIPITLQYQAALLRGSKISKSGLKPSLKILLNWFLGPLIFILLSWSLYRQIMQQPDLEQRWSQISAAWKHPASWLVLALMLLNWGIEGRKWQVLIQHLEPSSWVRAFKAVLAGCSITMLTPNRIGEYGGRILYVEEENRIKAISLTIVGSISQLLVTLTMGCAGLLYLKYLPGDKGNGILPALWDNVLIGLTLVVTAFLFLFYLRIGWLVRMMEKIPALQRVVRHIRVLDEFNNIQLLRVFSLSLGRYLVFILQYLLLLHVMQVELHPLTGFWLIAVFYLLMAVAPTIGFAELPLRVTACWALLQYFTSNELGVGAAALGIWLVNLVLPSIIGSLLILGVRVVKEKNV